MSAERESRVGGGGPNSAGQPLLDALAQGRAFGVERGTVERIETHISCIFLAGEHAYKLKKAVDLGFVDFTTLDRRLDACREELRLNTRLAPDVYLRVAAVTGPATDPALDGSGPVLDYLVVMHRFPQSALFSNMLDDGRLEERHVLELSRRLADFHAEQPAANRDQPYGSPPAVRRRTMENLETLPDALPESSPALASLREWTELQFQRLAEIIDRRRAQGRVRECHGDLHLDNIIHWHGRVMAFDGIEFDPDLRWIDVANELAFVTMDLDDRGSPVFARLLRNGYLEQTGDYNALAVLPFYQVYRALVRAKINALQSGQQTAAAKAQHSREQARQYLALAQAYTQPHSPALILMHGVSGTGKSTLTEQLIRHRGFLRLRSDVIRKQLFDLAPGQRSAAAGKSIYTDEASRRTYQRMREYAETALAAGYSVVLDATFLKEAHRRPFVELARRLGVAWRIVNLQGDAAVLRERVADRSRLGADPSEADTAVLERQFREQESLAGAERENALNLDIASIPADWHEGLPG